MRRWQDVCGDKLVSVEEALDVIRPGQTVGIGVNANAPEFLCHAFARRIRDWNDWSKNFKTASERIEAAAWLLPILLPAQGGKLVYVDGHMIAYWSRKAMHKGKITRRGRIMAGSQ
ncbi:hypothetical protein C2W62_43575, partial [Candidatus Entotheonella serta]